MKSFLTTKNYLSRSNVKSSNSIKVDNAAERREMKNVDKLVAKLTKLRDFLQTEIKWAQAKQEEYANAHRAPASEFKESDMIMLNVRFQITRRQSKFLNYKNLESYRIVRKIDNMIYQLELSSTMTGVFPIFHSWLLHLNDGVPLQSQRIVESKSIESKGDMWEIDEIMNSKIDKRRNDPKTEAREECLRYLVRWTEHENDNTTLQWLNWTKVRNSPYVVADFHHKNSADVDLHSSFVIPENWTAPK